MSNWTPLDLTALPDVQLLACDPSLTALGIVWVGIEDSTVTVHAAEKLATAPTERKGWDDTFLRAAVMEQQLDALLDIWFDSLKLISQDHDEITAVHELPPTGGGDFVRTEATILAGYAFRSVAKEYGMTILQGVTPQSHKKLICGNHIAGKKEHHAALKLLLPSIQGGGLIKNEAHRDALSVAIYAASRIGSQAKS